MTALDLKARISDEIGKLAEWDRPLTIEEIENLEDIWDALIDQAEIDALQEERRVRLSNR